MTTPWFQLQDLAKRHGIIAFSSNYALYGDLSHRFHRVVGQFSPQQEIYSIDESFLSLVGFGHFDLTDYGQAIRQRVLQWVGLPVCVGIAPTKTLAKLANHVAKRCERYQGVFDYSRLTADQQSVLLDSIPVDEVWGVGGRLTQRLEKLGITTVRHLRDAAPKQIRQHFSVTLERTVLELNGRPLFGTGSNASCQAGNRIVPVIRAAGHPVSGIGRSGCQLHRQGRGKTAASTWRGISHPGLSADQPAQDGRVTIFSRHRGAID
jgi:hypothetical protein